VQRESPRVAESPTLPPELLLLSPSRHTSIERLLFVGQLRVSELILTLATHRDGRGRTLNREVPAAASRSHHSDIDVCRYHVRGFSRYNIPAPCFATSRFNKFDIGFIYTQNKKAAHADELSRMENF